MDMRRADVLMGRDACPLRLLLWLQLVLVLVLAEGEEVGIEVRKKRGWRGMRGMRKQGGEERRMKRWAEEEVESARTDWV